MVLAITGHRPNKIGGYKPNQTAVDIKKFLELLVDSEKPSVMISGMALGVDTIWARVALEKRIPLVAAIPFWGQERMWPKESQEEYSEILRQATKVVPVSEGGYAVWKMQKRNEWMVDHCDKLVYIWDGSPGGTKNCIDYARKVGKAIIECHLFSESPNLRRGNKGGHPFGEMDFVPVPMTPKPTRGKNVI